MTQASSSLAQFHLVAKRDGRLVPFDADRISRALFAVTESLGQPDAFLARELTDAVLHFLGAEADGAIPSTEQIAETVIKVVRELGHARLAQAFAQNRRERAATPRTSAESTPVEDGADILLSEISVGVEANLSAAGLTRYLSRASLRAYSLRTVFSRDTVAAHRDGLLTLGNLGSPLELSGALLPPTPTDAEGAATGLVERIEEARGHVGDYLAIDGPEYALLHLGDAAPAQYARELRIGLRASGLRAVVNLNVSRPPAWAGDFAEGPLFAGQRRPPDPEHLAARADALLDALLPLDATGDVRVDWHLSERDFTPEGAARLTRLARRAGEGAALAFVFDRVKRPLHLAEGLDRQHVAALMTVGLNLPRLAEQPKLRDDPGLFILKLGSLVRMALSAAAQKRDFLRRRGQGRPALTRGFLLQRARLLLAPVGLETVARLFHGRGLCEGGAGLDFAKQVLQRLRETLRQDGAAHHLDTCIDGPATLSLDDTDSPVSAERVAGSACWDEAATPAQQLRSSSPLQAIAEMGTVAVILPSEQSVPTEEIVELLRKAWQKTETVRLRFTRPVAATHQLTVPWNDER